ncbi:MAG: DnaJ domain-containing protein [Candidatus Magnetomorum sp.]|nr:DnaJ domain-containing protein [Candidatus Magnetomorum sp.]
MSNDTFEKHLACVPSAEIKSYLISTTEPCYESTLLRIAFPDIDIVRCNTLELYQHHFVLFHLLYQLQEVFAEKGQYLHVHFMRTQVLDYPEIGHCCYFDEIYQRFCNETCDPTSGYCDFHRRLVGETELDSLSIRYFYMDISNYYKLDEKTAELFVKGTWEILANYDLYKESFALLGISETNDLSRIKKCYRKLAKEHHPDRGAESLENFYKINNAYQLLMRIIPLMNM